MLSKSYDKRVELWEVSDIDDGFGGFVTSETFIVKRWCNIKTKNSFVNKNNGKVENFNTTVFSFRGINNFSLSIKINFLKYKGIKYVINSVENGGLEGIELVVNCTAYDSI